MTPHQALETAFQELAPYSDRHRWEFFNNLEHIKILTKHLHAGDRILDIGSGMGIVALALTKLGYQVDGLDKYVFLPDTYISLSANAIENLRTIWAKNNLQIINKDIQDFIPNTQYDCVINIAVIEHQRDPKKFIQNCLAHLKPNGLFFCVTPNMVDVLNRLRVLAGRSAFRDLKSFFEAGEKFVGHWREYTLKEVVQMCEWSGLKTIAAHNSRTSPYFNKKDSWTRSLFTAPFRFVGTLIPGGSDTNLVLARKST